MSQSKNRRRHKITKSDNENENEDASRTGLVEPLSELPGTMIARTSSRMLSVARPDDQDAGLKRKSSALLNYSEASSFRSLDPEVEEWESKVDRALLQYASKKRKKQFVPATAQKELQKIFPDLPWDGPSLRILHERNPTDPYLEYAKDDMKNFVQLVLKIGLDETNHPFPQETVNMLLTNEKPHLDFDVTTIGTETFCEVVSLLQEKHYWTGICTLFPSLRLSGNPKNERWWKEAKEDAVRDWNRAFVDRGVAIAVFHRMLRAPPVQDGERKPYAKILPLVQTSGTGKSRLLKHLFNCVPGVYISLANSKYVLPARDDQVFDFIKGEDMVTTRFICLFDALFRKAFDKLQLNYNLSQTQRQPEKPIAPISTQEQLARSFQENLDSSGSDGRDGRVSFPLLTQARINFMTDVVEEAEKTLAKLKDDPRWDREEKHLSGPRSNWNETLKKLVMDDFIMPWNAKLVKLRKYGLAPCKAIEDLLKAKGLIRQGFPAQFIFCIDELTKMELFKETNRDKKQEVFEQVRHHMERAASFFYSLDVWFVYTSPFPHLTAIQPSRWHSSDRVSSGEYALPKPFCTMPFHIGASEHMSGGLRSQKPFDTQPMNTFSDLQHLTLYGRTMWTQFLNAGEEDFNRILFGRLMGHYYDRMTPRERIESGWQFDEKNPSHIFSIISVRAFLDPIVGAHSSMDSFFTDNVLKHLCPLKDLNRDHGIIQLDQYMDPPLAGAVTRFFTRGPSNWPTLIKALSMLLANYPVRDLKGERGKLFTRLICLNARDRAWANHLKALKQDHAPASSPFPLHQFLNALLPNTVRGWRTRQNFKFGGDIVDVNGVTRKKTLKDVLNNAYVNFTHFVLCEKPLDKDTIPFVLSNLLRQNAALICKPGQTAWDFLIPYYNGDPAKAFDRDGVSSIAFQVKHRKASETDFVGDFQKIEEDLSSSKKNKKGLEEYMWYRDFTGLNLAKSPLITILCEVGRNPGRSSSTVDLKTIEGHGTVFGLRLIGNNEDTYGCLQGDKAFQDAFATLLGCTYDPFVSHSEYEGEIAAGNILFENAQYFPTDLTDSDDEMEDSSE